MVAQLISSTTLISLTVDEKCGCSTDSDVIWSTVSVFTGPVTASKTAPNVHLITAAPGFGKIPQCAQQALTAAFAFGDFDICSTTNAPETDVVSCLCRSAYGDILNYNSQYAVSYYSCEWTKYSSATPVLSAYCVANDKGVLGKALINNSPLNHATTSNSNPVMGTSAGNATQSSTMSDYDLNGAQIAGIVTGVIVAIILLFLISALCCFKGLLRGLLAVFSLAPEKRRRTEETVQDTDGSVSYGDSLAESAEQVINTPSPAKPEPHKTTYASDSGYSSDVTGTPSPEGAPALLQRSYRHKVTNAPAGNPSQQAPSAPFPGSYCQRKKHAPARPSWLHGTGPSTRVALAQRWVQEQSASSDHRSPRPTRVVSEGAVATPTRSRASGSRRFGSTVLSVGHNDRFLSPRNTAGHESSDHTAYGSPAPSDIVVHGRLISSDR